jgi:hypothetical protein
VHATEPDFSRGAEYAAAAMRACARDYDAEHPPDRATLDAAVIEASEKWFEEIGHGEDSPEEFALAEAVERRREALK